MPKNGRLAKNLIHACENLADHLTHFYCFFMPDFARETYAGQPWHPSISARFQALKGSGLADFLPARAGFLRVMGYLAGKWPHTLALQPGEEQIDTQDGDQHWRFTVPQVALDGAQLAHREWEL